MMKAVRTITLLSKVLLNPNQFYLLQYQRRNGIHLDEDFEVELNFSKPDRELMISCIESFKEKRKMTSLDQRLLAGIYDVGKQLRVADDEPFELIRRNTTRLPGKAGEQQPDDQADSTIQTESGIDIGIEDENDTPPPSKHDDQIGCQVDEETKHEDVLSASDTRLQGISGVVDMNHISKGDEEAVYERPT